MPEIHLMKRIAGLLPFLGLLISYFPTQGQPTTYPFKVQQERMLWHDNVDKQQKRLLALDGKPDDSLHLSKDENINLEIADAMIRQVDGLQEKIELDSTLSGQSKIKYLRSLESMLKGYNNNYKKKDFPPAMAPRLVDAFVKAMDLDRNNKSIEPVIEENIYGIGKILIDCFLLPSENVGIKPSRIVLIRKYAELHPEEIFNILS